MRSSDGPVSEMFETLWSRPVCERRLSFLDMALAIRFADERLGRYLCRTLDAWEERPVPPERAIRCVIDYTDVVPHWREVFVGDLRSVASDLFGEMQMLGAQDGYAVLLEKFGAVLRTTRGDMMCLVDDVEGRRHDGDPCNLSTAACLITASCLLRNGYLVVHAGGVARHGRCQVWTGPSGIGKTTRVLDLVSRGWDYYGDDVLVLGRDERGAWHVFPYSRTARVTSETCSRFTQLASLADGKRTSDKYVFDVDRLFATTIPASGVLDRICCIGPEPESYPRRLGESEAITRLMAGFLYYLWPEDANRVLDGMWDVVSKVPVYAVSRDTRSDDGVET
ncbi:MAG: hypothetical protein JW955_00470 [Sedimentisphaerales bacterium]|nr:hypothetical protein [Sedimentisphaerales bacterium]